MRNTIFITGLIFLLSIGCGDSAKVQSTDQKDAPEQTTSNASASVQFDFEPNPEPVAKQEVKTLAIGDRAPDFRLPGIDDRYHALSDFDAAKVLVVVFTCNHCPTAQAYEDRIIDITNDYKSRGVQVVAISPNSPLGLLPEELGYSDLGDDFDDMKIRHKDKGYNFPYLYDGDNQKVSLAYGPLATPHTFVFDENRMLKYIGRIDNSEKPGTANGEDLRDAIDAVLEGKAIAQPTTKAIGCSTKWGWKIELKEQAEKDWAKKKIALKNIGLSDLKKLVKNDTEKLRLINVWATWCGPCRVEYPWFVEIQRMYGQRDFEFVSLSLDKPDKEKDVLDFLNKMNSAVDNYLAENMENETIINTLDEEWNGNLPMTMLIAPGGEVIYSEYGVVDFFELKKAIVDHKMMGRYF